MTTRKVNQAKGKGNTKPADKLVEVETNSANSEEDDFDVEAKAAQYESDQRKRFEDRLAKRVESFRKNVAEKGSVERELIALKLLKQKLKDEKAALSKSIAEINVSIKGFRPKRKSRRPKNTADANTQGESAAG